MVCSLLPCNYMYISSASLQGRLRIKKFLTLPADFRIQTKNKTNKKKPPNP